MFDFSIVKIVFTLVIGFLILGPSRMTQLAHALGKYWKILRRSIDKAKDEFETYISEEELKKLKELKNKNFGSKIKLDLLGVSNDNEVADIKLSEKTKISN